MKKRLILYGTLIIVSIVYYCISYFNHSMSVIDVVFALVTFLIPTVDALFNEGYNRLRNSYLDDIGKLTQLCNFLEKAIIEEENLNLKRSRQFPHDPQTNIPEMISKYICGNKELIIKVFKIHYKFNKKKSVAKFNECNTDFNTLKAITKEIVERAKPSLSEKTSHGITL